MECASKARSEAAGILQTGDRTFRQSVFTIPFFSIFGVVPDPINDRLDFLPEKM